MPKISLDLLGAVFDWDGVIIDSHDQHEKAWAVLADEIGKPLPEGFFRSTFGMRNESVLPLLGWAAEGDQAAIEIFEVPGAFELPLHARCIAETGRFDAVVAAGFVVDGGIYRHEFVASTVIDGLMRVQLDTETPVFSCVLTPHQFHDHADHLNFFKEHLAKKGTEVAESAISFITQLAEQA